MFLTPPTPDRLVRAGPFGNQINVSLSCVSWTSAGSCCQSLKQWFHKITPVGTEAETLFQVPEMKTPVSHEVGELIISEFLQEYASQNTCSYNQNTEQIEGNCMFLLVEKNLGNADSD